VLEAYASRNSGDGMLKLSDADLTRIVSTLDSHGWQIAVAANGDRAVRAALDAYEAAAAPRSRVAEGRRHRIEGVELVDPDDVARFKTLGVIASLQPLHARSDRLQVWSRNVGGERAALGFASHSIGKVGVRLAFGSDWPSLPLDPVAGLNAAVNRAAQAHSDPDPDPVPYASEALTLKSAINAWTSGAAWASFDEHRKGMIKPGMLADLVVLSSDILTGSPDRLASSQVDVTIFDGKVVYQRDRRHSTN